MSMCKLRNLVLVDLEVSGHHFELYIKRAIEFATGDMEVYIFVPISCKNDIPSLVVFQSQSVNIDFFSDVNDLVCRIQSLTISNDDTNVVLMSADLWGLNEYRALIKGVNGNLVSLLFIKSNIANAIYSYKSMIKALVTILKILYASFSVRDLRVSVLEENSFFLLKRIFKYLASVEVRYLPDYSEAEGIGKYSNVRDDVVQKFRDDGILRILVIGHIAGRKGIVELCSALSSVNFVSHVIFEIVGVVEDSYFNVLVEALGGIHNVDVNMHNKFVSKNDYFKYINNANVIWLGYLGKDVGSSGVLVDAVYFKKNILVTRYGYLGFLAKKYSLKYVIDPRDPHDIVCSIDKIVNDVWDDQEIKYSMFLKDHSKAKARIAWSSLLSGR